MLGDAGCHQASGAGIDWQWCAGVDLDTAGILAGQMLQRGDVFITENHTGSWAVGLVKPPIDQNGVNVSSAICRSLCSSSWHCHTWLVNAEGCWLEDKAHGYTVQKWQDDTAEAQAVTAGETFRHVCKWHKLPKEPKPTKPPKVKKIKKVKKVKKPKQKKKKPKVDGQPTGSTLESTIILLGFGVIIVGGFVAAVAMRVPKWCCSPFVACRGYILGRKKEVATDLPVAHPSSESPPQGDAREGKYRILSLVQNEPLSPVTARSSQPLIE